MKSRVKKYEFVLEIGLEELPSRHCLDILKNFEKNLAGYVQNAGLEAVGLNYFITPRRLIVVAESLFTKSNTTEIKGPIADIAMTNGKYNEIAQKFAERNEGSLKDLEVREFQDKKYVYFVKKIESSLVESVSSLTNQIFESQNFDRTMRWDSSGFSFSRPVRWILCLVKDKVCQFEVKGIRSDRLTYGPRFKDSNEIFVSRSEKYVETLAKNDVLVDHRSRAIEILKALKSYEKKGFSTMRSPDKLIDEITFLVENPLPVECQFEERFLELPAEVIEAVLVKHQRYFPLYKNKGSKLTNKFLVIANHSRMTSEIRSGNEKVVRARLSDGLFFYKKDQGLTLDDFNKKISNIVFQEKLGSLADKVKRVGEFVSILPKTFSSLQKPLKTAAQYMKADQSTTLVSEFSSLEGVVGRIYAKNEGLDLPIAEAIQDYYKPRFSGDSLPASDLSKLLSVIDRYDTLFGLFSNGFIPKGNSDPYGLRRIAIGLSRILWDSDLEITLADLAAIAKKVYKSSYNVTELHAFIADRLAEELKNTYKDIDSKMLRAVLASDTDYLFQKRIVLSDLISLQGSSKLSDFLEFAKRLANINEKSNVNVEKYKIEKPKLNTSEKEFYTEITMLSEMKVIKVADLIKIVGSGNQFFAKNMIMSEVEHERRQRLALVSIANKLVGKVINMSVYLHKD